MTSPRGAADHGLFTIPEKCTAIEKTGQVVEEKILNQRALHRVVEEIKRVSDSLAVLVEGRLPGQL